MQRITIDQFLVNRRFIPKSVKVKIVLRYRDLVDEDYVTIKCRRCGQKWCFFPYRALRWPTCDCGNEVPTVSEVRETWKHGDFGKDWKLVAIERLEFPRLTGLFGA